jgi:hypothetical protein
MAAAAERDSKEPEPLAKPFGDSDGERQEVERYWKLKFGRRRARVSDWAKEWMMQRRGVSRRRHRWRARRHGRCRHAATALGSVVVTVTLCRRHAIETQRPVLCRVPPPPHDLRRLERGALLLGLCDDLRKGAATTPRTTTTKTTTTATAAAASAVATRVQFVCFSYRQRSRSQGGGGGRGGAAELLD